MPARRPLVLCLLLLAALTAPAAKASPFQFSVMMDDDQLVYRTANATEVALKRMQALGVDYVRVTMLWKVVANDIDRNRATRRAFRKYGPADPRAYPRRSWNRYDNLVTAARNHNIGVYFNLTGPGPAYGHEKAPRSQQRNRETWKPIPRQYKLWIEAVGKRYSGTYRDEDTGHQVLPRVSFWSLWNEPNQGGWLTPQYVGGKPYSPYLFRKLAIAGYQALLATGHGKDEILLGETAPLGSHGRNARSQMYPVTFIRSLFCVDSAGNADDSGPGCGDFGKYGPLRFSAWGHHPYTKDRGPTEKDPDPNAITMANLDKLTGLLDRIGAKTGRFVSNLPNAPAQMPIALTEFGYETKPPDPIHGISLAKQADFSNVADLMAFYNPRVIAQTQFLLRDVPPLKRYRKTDRRYWFTYQSGLFYANYKPKPSAAAYAFPFAGAKVSGSTWSFWGQLRFRPNGVQDYVLLQYRANGTSTWQQLGDAFAVQVPQRGYFLATRDVPGPGKVRAVWFGTGSPYGISGRTVAVG